MKKLIILILMMNSISTFVSGQDQTDTIGTFTLATTSDYLKDKKGITYNWEMVSPKIKWPWCIGANVAENRQCNFFNWAFGWIGNIHISLGSGWGSGIGAIPWDIYHAGGSGPDIKYTTIVNEEDGWGGGGGIAPNGWVPPKIDQGTVHNDGANTNGPDIKHTDLQDDGNLCKGCISDIISIQNKINYLTTFLHFNQTQTNWLLQNSDYLNQLYDLLEDETEWDEETLATAMINLELARLNLIDNWNEVLFKQILVNYLPAPLRIYVDVIVPYLKLQYALESEENPTLKNSFLGKLKLLYLAQEELMHFSLDIAGLFPVVGEIFDVANGAWYALQGNYFDATLSVVSSIPFFGTIPAGARIVKNGRKIIMLKKANGLWHFPRKNLRNLLGLLKGDPRIAHHIIPLITEEHDLVQAAAKAGYDMNALGNAIALDGAIHTGSHDLYSSKLKTLMDNTWNSNMTPQQDKTELKNIKNNIKNLLDANPGININNLNF